MRIRGTNWDVVFHRGILREPIDAVRRAMGLPVTTTPGPRTIGEELRPLHFQRRAAVPQRNAPATAPQVALPTPPGLSTMNPGEIFQAAVTKIATEQKDIAARIDEQHKAMTTVKPSQAIISPASTVHVVMHTSSRVHDNGKDAKAATAEEGKASSDSDDSNKASSDDSNRTIVRRDVKDPVQASNIFIKAGGMKRMIESVPAELQHLVKSVIEQAKTSDEIVKLSDPSSSSDGMASFPVNLEGETLTAFLSFAFGGRITAMDASDSSLVARFEASDSGSTDTGAASSSAAAAAVIAPPLQPASGVEARVDVSGQFQSVTPPDGGGTLYQYRPRADADHGISVAVTDSGDLWLSRIEALPALVPTLGSGTDMMLGLAKKLNEDGCGIKQIRGEWVNQPGVDSQYKQYREGIDSEMSPRDAAMGTFFGKVALMFGFTDVEVTPSPEDASPADDFQVTFKRPTPPT